MRAKADTAKSSGSAKSPGSAKASAGDVSTGAAVAEGAPAGGELADAVGEVTAEQVAHAGSEPTPEARARHADLAAEVDQHQYRYYVLAQPTASDAEYDALIHDLTRLE